MAVLVYLEQKDGVLKDSAHEVLSQAHVLGGEVAACVCGPKAQDVAASLEGWGVSKLFCNDSDYHPVVYGDFLAQAAEAWQGEYILAVNSAVVRDFYPRAAARLSAALISDIVGMEAQGGGSVQVKKPLYAGKVIGTFSFTAAAGGTKMLALRANTCSVLKPAKGEAPAVENLSSEETLGLACTEVSQVNTKEADLSEAQIIISGGRSLGSAEAFKVLRDCAAVIGASVGASRAAVDAGYARHDMQVGQTGKTVNPKLYIACGISGAIQHLAGMRSSKVIVAINTDSSAPIFKIADYGIVGDLFEVVPQLQEQLAKVLQ